VLGAASTIRAFSVEAWVGLPAARARCVRHFLALAATLAAAKVMLSTIGVALFVAEQGAAGLPPFYLGFAGIAILLSFGLSLVIDRVPKVRLAQLTFAGLLLGTAALRLLLTLEVPGVSFALLASATAFEIILDILFWVVVAAYLDAFEFRRVTPLVYMALALGGAAGGARTAERRSIAAGRSVVGSPAVCRPRGSPTRGSGEPAPRAAGEPSGYRR
jgi:hypothetical protein